MEYKNTLNLPATEFPMKANLAQKEPEILDQWEAGALCKLVEAGKGQAEIYPARRPPLRQRPYPYRPRPEQDPQGHHPQEQAHEGFQRPLCAGMGLPRPPHRAPGGKEPGSEKARDGQARDAQEVPRIRGQIRRDPEGGVQAPRRAGGLGQPLPDHELQLRGPPPGNWPRSPRTAASTRARSRSTGAPPAAPPWPRPRWSTPTTRPPPSM